MRQVDTAVSSYLPDAPKIIQLKRILEEKLQTFGSLDQKIVARTAEGDIEIEIIQANEVKEKILLALSQQILHVAPVRPYQFRCQSNT